MWRAISARPDRGAARKDEPLHIDPRTGRLFSSIVTVMAVPVLPKVWPAQQSDKISHIDTVIFHIDSISILSS
jgi:hypothetical protein